MAYRVLNDTDIKQWNNDYKALADALANEHDPAEQAKLTAKMQSLGTQVEEHLNEIGREIKANLKVHLDKVDRWVSLSDQAIGKARKAAAAYKKDTSAGQPAEIQQAEADMTLWVKAIGDDSREFGAAWFSYRGEMASHLPAKNQAAFKMLRTKVMEDQKIVTIRQTKIKGYIAEAEGLRQVTAKATMKAGIKAGTAEQRQIAAAQQDARDLAAQMAAELELLRNPPGLATPPATISTALGYAKESSKDKTLVKNNSSVIMVNGRKKTFESGIKLMRTRVASMDKLLAVKTKGFRKNELADAVVKAQLKLAQASLKTAKAELAVSETEAKKGQEYLAIIEKRWASKGK